MCCLLSKKVETNKLKYIFKLNEESHPGLETKFGMLWRFAPMADEYVSEWHSRDLDATILEREVLAVQEWKKTNYTFHIMRDNPAHVTDILGGMFGIQQHTNDSKLMRRAEFEKMVHDHGSGWTKGDDQIALTNVLTHSAVEDSVVHDSYLCLQGYLEGALQLPFPTQRLSGQNFTKPAPGVPNFVGNTGNDAIVHVCPVQCRPKDHKDWLLC